MKKILLSTVIFMAVITGMYSQINYENGYIINNAGKKIDCLIRNEAWGTTPTQFQYKLAENDNALTGSLTNTKEFSVPGQFKYTRYLVKIDRSSDNVRKMSQQEAPEFKEENLFLEVLMEGDATLFLYEDGNLKRYFYTLKDQIANPEQLIYKRYKTYETGSNNVQGAIFKNQKFREQLWNTLKCNNTSITAIKDMRYTDRDMMKVFTAYNECGNAEITNYLDKKGNGVFNVRISAGLNSSSLSMDSENRLSNFDRNIDFDNAISIRGGIEVEYVFAFNKNKWAVFAEPNYNYYNESGENEDQTAEVEYTSIEVPIGIRHYMFMNDRLKLFVNASINLDFTLGDQLVDYSVTRDFDVASGSNLGLGLGLAIGEKFMIETRYNTSNSIVENTGVDSNFNKASLIFRYKIF